MGDKAGRCGLWMLPPGALPSRCTFPPGALPSRCTFPHVYFPSSVHPTRCMPPQKCTSHQVYIPPGVLPTRCTSLQVYLGSSGAYHEAAVSPLPDCGGGSWALCGSPSPVFCHVCMVGPGLQGPSQMNIINRKFPLSPSALLGAVRSHLAADP